MLAMSDCAVSPEESRSVVVSVLTSVHGARRRGLDPANDLKMYHFASRAMVHGIQILKA